MNRIKTLSDGVTEHHLNHSRKQNSGCIEENRIKGY
jgi:hypothetical protein